MSGENDAVAVLRDSVGRLQRIASDLKNAEIAEQIRRIALDCDSDAVELERFISQARPKSGERQGLSVSSFLTDLTRAMSASEAANQSAVLPPAEAFLGLLPHAMLEYLQQLGEHLQEMAKSTPGVLGVELLKIADQIADDAARLEVELSEMGYVPPRPANQP